MKAPAAVDIAGRRVGAGDAAYVIAEAGSNHNRDLATALALIDAAAHAKADAVKFQSFTADALVARTSHPIATLRDGFARFGKTVHEMFTGLELPAEWLPRLQEQAHRRGIEFLSTPFDEQSADLLAKLDMPAFKIATYEIVHLPLLRHVAGFGKPLLLSTGMASMEEVAEAVAAVRAQGNDQIALFHTPIGYPVEPAAVNLAVIDTLREAFDVPVGLSDHTLGITIPVAAVARGANLVEKHFTLDSSQAGPDHGFAIEPDQLEAMVSAIRAAESAVGDPVKRCLESERLYYERGRRSLFAAVAIGAGEPITRDKVAVLRPGVGLAPKFLDTIVGRRARRAMKAFDPITWDDV